MRDIKFRAWHSGGNHPEEAVMLHDKAHHMLKWLDEGQPASVMQFTGLKDKNGVEVYEGDIVKSTPRDGRGTGKFKVLYDAAYGSFICLFISWSNFNTSSPESYPLGEARFDIEVIGNIHENPELLK